MTMEQLELRLQLASDLLAASDLFSASPDGIWELRPRIPATQGVVSYLHPTEFSSVVLDAPVLATKLASAPLEFTNEATHAPLLISLPTPDHGFSRFAVVQSPIMDPVLAAQFPEILTYSGQGIDDPAATLRFDLTPAGFHAQILSPSGAFYIDPYWHLDDSVYISYFKRDLTRPSDMEFVEGPIDDPIGKLTDSLASLAKPDPNNAVSTMSLGSINLSRSGAQLRTYRLANAATGEFTAFHGGTVASGQAAIVTAINRVDGIYESELSIRLVLVGNNSSLVYTNAATDPYTNSNASSLLTQNQSTVDSIIGSANYDIGHVFSTGGGGLAGLGVVGVGGRKAQGETGSPSPIGDAFYVDYVAHEMGHQFGGNHTFNGVTSSCGGGNRNAGTAYEPGSGSTIQAYAGICGADDLQPHSDPYFHSVSFDEIVAYTTSGTGNAVANITTTGNNIPTVNAGLDYVIPARTPFVLTAAGTDADASDVLTYNWEERDLGAAQLVSSADNGSSPIFRSFNPTTSSERVFPRLTNLINNTTTVGEKLPTTTRTLKFRATVRDNRSGGGGVNTDDMQISVVDTGTAFAVTSPNTAIAWAGNSAQTVTWNVSNTTAAPINTANVNIWLSTDGGASFPILLLANTPNDGSQSVTIPDRTSTIARIKVEAVDNIYFDISNANFTIAGSANTPPTISDILNQSIGVNSTTGAIPFTIDDLQTAPANLVVAASSNNQTLVPNGNIVLGGSGANRTITVTPASGQIGQAIVTVSVTDTGGLTVQDTFIVLVAGVITCSAFESFDGVTVPALPAGWTSVATGSAAVNWTTSTTTSSSAPNSVFVSNPTNISDSRLTSPTIAVTQANYQFRFKNNYNLESTYDGGVLEVSINGGAFADLVTAGGKFTAGGYNGTLDSGFSSPLAGRLAWTGNSAAFIDTIAELPASAIGSNVQLRWRMGSDSSLAAVGWRIDSIQQCGTQPPNSPPTAIVLTPAIASLAENSNTISATALSTVSVVDDGIGNNVLSLSGTDATSFEIVGNQLRLKAGVLLDFEQKASYAVTVNVDDPTVGASPDQSANFVLSVTNVNEAPIITANAGQVSGNVFSNLTNNGTWSDPEAGNVTLTTSLGTVVKNSNGTWNWSITLPVPVVNQTVSVTATDDGGLSSLVSFSLSNFLTVIGGQVYYKGSDFDTSNGIPSALDSSKALLRPGAISKTTSFENVSNYALGINGIVLDLAGFSTAPLSVSDFIFRVAPTGSSGIVTPSAWDSAPAPTLINIQSNGPSASRIRLEWADNAIQNTWLQIVFLQNANTALQNPVVFYVGHALGEVDGSTPYRLSTIDIGMVRAEVGNALVPVSDARDVDKDQRITTADVGFLRARVSNAILLDDITVPATGSPSEGSARNGLRSAAVLLNPETTPQLDNYIDDGTLRHDKAGRAYFYDTDEITQSSAGRNEASPTTLLKSPQPGSPLGLTVPVYHSNPNFAKKIYLDFDGQQITGSSWNNDNYTGTYNTGNVINAPPFSTDSDLTTFSTSEQAAIQDVWARVSEDYALYQVDVTTEEPNASTFTAGKQAIRAMITTDVDATSGTQWFPNAGGVAYLGSWDWKDGSPVWIFTNHLGSSKTYAEAASHEVGHAFNLNHDGRNSPAEGYYQGHGAGATGWAPIMGVGYYRPVSQWSKGEYTSANNTEDDLAIINSRLVYQVDDHGNTSASATQLVVGSGGAIANSGVITTRTDVDAFRFATQTGSVTINVDPLGVSAGKGNLDASISVLNSAGAVVASNNGIDVLNASLTTTLSKGTYTILVDGVGRAAIPGDQGYSDYASLGQFTLSGTVVPNQPPLALADIVNVGVNQSKLLDVLANDSDPNLDLLSIQSIGTPAVGTISIESGKIRFTPPNGYLGTVTFPYTIVDELGATASASVTVNVVPNTPPAIGVNQATVVGNEGTVITNSGTWSDVDVPPNPVSLSASIGTVTKNANGTWNWQITAPNQIASTQVTISADDEMGGATSVSFTYSALNVAPTLTTSLSSVSGNVLAPINNSGTWNDVPADTVSITASFGQVTKNSNGTWNWSVTSATAIANQTVIITATDSDGLSSTTSFLVDSLVAVSASQVYYKGSEFSLQGGVTAALESTKKLLRASAVSQTTTFANVTNYSLGLNGVVLDLAGLANTNLSASDFVFRVAPTGASGVVSPNTWNYAPPPTLIDVTAGNESTPARIRIEWPDNAIQNTWLQIIVSANANTGLINRNVFYIGHALGEVDGLTPYRLTTIDVGLVRALVGNAIVPVNESRDVDKDQRITTVDIGFMRGRVDNAILLDDITVPPVGDSAEGEAVRGSPAPAPNAIESSSSIKPWISDAIYKVELPIKLVHDHALSLQLVATESAAFDFMENHKDHLDEFDLNVLTAKEVDACFRVFSQLDADFFAAGSLS